MDQPAPALVLSAAAFVGACCSGATRRPASASSSGLPSAFDPIRFISTRTCWFSDRSACRDRSQERSQTVVLIGMRGAGKTTLGRGAAEALGFDFQDLDKTLEEDAGMTCRDFVAAHGWETFRSKELEVLTAALASRGSARSRDRVLACGGGVVENVHAMALLRAWRGGWVVWIDRPIDTIVAAFGGEGGRPWGGFDEVKLREMFARRKPLYGQACDHRLEVSCDATAATAQLTGWIRQSIDGQHGEPFGAVLSHYQALGLLLLCLRQQFSPNR